VPLENTIRSQGTLWTDLHSTLHIFHGTVDGLLEPVTCFLGESLEPRSREPVWEMSYCPRFRQLLVGAVRMHRHARIGMASARNFPGTKAVANTRDALRPHSGMGRRLTWVYPVGYGQYNGSGHASGVRMHKRAVWLRRVGNDEQLSLLHETLRRLQQPGQEGCAYLYWWLSKFSVVVAFKASWKSLRRTLHRSP
jgi:hypothetical protein